jgi:hypothetical protein
MMPKTIKRYAGTLVVLLVASHLISAQVSAEVGVPLLTQQSSERTGTVDAVDTATGQVVIDDRSYAITAATRGAGYLRKGAQVQFRYSTQGERRVLQDVGPAQGVR